MQRYFPRRVAPAYARRMETNAPLAGIRVLDLSGYIAGPFAASLLADLGAEVVKVEPPGGDPIRHYPSTLPGRSRVFLGVNRGKRGLVLDLKDPAGKATLLAMADEADVLLENFRPGVMERLGLGWALLSARNPRLVWCSLTGFGETGPLAGAAGFDQVLQAMTGLAALQGQAAGGPPQLLSGSAVDFYAASLAALGIVAALHQRHATGRGERVGMSLLAAALAMQAGRLVWADDEGREADRDLRQGRVAGIHPTRAGFLYLSATTDHFWRALCRLTGLAAMAEDPRFATVRDRAERADAILPALHAALAARTAAEWEALMRGQVPCAVVGGIEDMFDHPQVQAEGLVAELEGYRGLASPFRFGDAPRRVPRCGAPGPIGTRVAGGE
ncbi:CaiB/BaiF CoA transferase family protein [Roseococcus sp. DSY-14]|uniref:CaiB/BaiF CoA transferase family protein n=1 Tax=Roseococcus sp. DSY-14 TaxID=3369650 RepID=UPI00387B1FB3